MRTIVVFGFWLTLSNISYAVSFSCKMATANTAEAVICSDEQLSKLDDQLSEQYAIARQATSQEYVPVLKAEQREWLKYRNRCVRIERARECIQRVYQSRIESLGKQRIADEVHDSSSPAPAALAVAIAVHIADPDRKSPLRYRFALTDLNNDGRQDAIVLLDSAEYCGSGGCTMEIYRGTESGYEYVSSNTITVPPIRVSPIVYSGWKSLIVFSNGTGAVTMKYSGKKYPLNPSMQRKTTVAEINQAEVIIDQLPCCK